MAAVILLNLSIQLTGLDPDKKISQYVHDTWGARQGLPHNTVIDILQTHDGYLWLTTEEGLVRFDGVRFEVFDKLRVPQFLSNSIWVLYQDSQGILRIGTNGSGLVSLDLNTYKFQSRTRDNGLPHLTVNSITQTGDGTIWIGSEGGLAFLKEGKLRVFSSPDLPSPHIRYVYADNQSNLWLAAGEHLRQMNLRSRKITVFTGKDGLNGDHVNVIYQDKQNRLWIGLESGLNRWENGKFITVPLNKNDSQPNVWTIIQDRDDNMWVGTYGDGIYRINGNSTESFSSSSGLSDDTIWKLFEDREGSIWIGTNSGGLDRLRDGKFTTYTRQEGLKDDVIWSIFQDRSGAVWLGTDKGGLNRITEQATEQTIRSYTSANGLPINRVFTIRQDKQDNLWIGTDGGGLSRITLNTTGLPETFTTFTTKNGLNNGRISDILIDGNTLWLATYGGGVNRFEDGRFTAYTSEIGLLENDTLCLLKDRNGDLWVGTESSGLNRLRLTKDGIDIKSYTKKEGLSGEYILSLYEDSTGALWIGTYSGLNRFKDGTFSHVTMKDGLFDDIAYVILNDGLGYFWMSCNRGVYRAAKKELNDFCDGNIQHVNCIAFDDNDGMESRECYGTSQPAGWKSRDGHLWFPTSKGAANIDPANIKMNSYAPPVKVEQIKVDDQTLPVIPSALVTPLILAPGSERIEIHYTALSYTVPQRVHFKCKLEPFDSEWQDMKARRTAYYTKLSPGNYTFRVTAHNDDGVWNERGTAISFYLKPYIYQTGWFKLLALLFLAAAAFTLIRLRIRALTRRKAMLENLVTKRTLELQLSNKELEKLSIVARETDNAVMLMDARGDLEWLNEGAIRMYGFTIDQLIEERGKNIAQVSSYHGIEKLLKEFLANPSPVRYESLYKTRKGRSIWTQITWTPVFDPHGQLSQIVAISSNITQIKESEERIKAQAEELKQAIKIAREQQSAANAANQAKNDFLARMSHELRTPMNGIVGFSEMLLDTSLTEIQQEYADTINRCGQGLSVMLNDILDFAKVEAGELKMMEEEFSPAEIIADACRMFRPRLEEKPVEIIHTVTGVPDYVNGDALRFRQVLVNLVGNAVKFTSRGEIDVSLSLERETGDDIMLHLQVRDTGGGIPEDKIEKIFDAFFQVDRYETRQHDGTGLGLAISRQIARLMKGEIWVESKEGEGSTFHFTSWMKTCHSPEPFLEKSSSATFSSNDFNILVAEDNAVNRKLLEHLLAKAGFRFELVNDGREVTDAFNEKGDSFDLILMDVQMPYMTGLEATRKIRETNSTIPIIAITAQAMKGDRERCLEAGMNDYIAKPIKQDEIFTKIYQWIGR